MFQFIKKPYPFNDDLKRNAKVIFVISISIFIFLILFQPLDISTLGFNQKKFLIAGLVVTTFLSLSLNLMIIPSLFPKIFMKREWIVWKEILWNLWILFTISVSYFVFYKALGILELNFRMVVTLIVIASFPLTLLIVFNQDRLLRLHLKTANELNAKLKDSKIFYDKLVHFDSENQKDKLSIKARLLILIKSADNYIEVFWKDGDAIKKQLIRGTLLKAGELLSDYSYIFKCHRSFIVNVNFIDRVEGNSQGYKLYFENIDFEVPVSKLAVEQLKELVRFL
jgi:hypothetical protein